MYNRSDHEAQEFLSNAISYALYESKPYRWLTLASKGDTLAAGKTIEIGVKFNASRMFGGQYLQNIIVASNDPQNEYDTIPVTLNVTGAPGNSGIGAGPQL